MRRYVLLLLATTLITPSFNSPIAATAITLSVPASEPDPAAVKAAIEEFKSLSRKEKKKKLKQLKKELSVIKASKQYGYETDTNTILLVILAFLLPPLAVYLHQGEINSKFWITLILWLLGWVAFTWLAWIPLIAAIIYALLVILGNA
jgi:uncharacterized membrane protein YqaE (UPF0057 family)